MRPIDPHRVRIAVGRRVAELREQAGLTQEKLAEQLDVSVKYIQRIERGVENLGTNSLVKLGNKLNVPPVAFFMPSDGVRAKGPDGRTTPRKVRRRLPQD